MKSRVAVLSAVFPEVIKYLPELIKSLANQSYRTFDWILVNDGVDYEWLRKAIADQLVWKNLEMKDVKPFVNRWKGIQYCLDAGYEIIIFQDADDWMTLNRVENSIDCLSKHSIAFNDLTLVNEQGIIIKENIWNCRLTSGDCIDSSFVQDKNCVGLGNAAVRTSILQKDLKIDERIVAIDWYVFYPLLTKHKAVFSSDANVFYRQYAGNTAGIGLLNKERIKRVIEVKLRHYSSLINSFPELSAGKARLESFEQNVFKKPDALNQYISKNNQRSLTSFWWEETNYPI